MENKSPSDEEIMAALHAPEKSNDSEGKPKSSKTSGGDALYDIKLDDEGEPVNEEDYF